MDDIAKRIGDIAAHAAASGQTPDDISNIVALEVRAVLKELDDQGVGDNAVIDRLSAALNEIAAHGEQGHAAFAQAAIDGH